MNPNAPHQREQIRVLVVDDSAIVRTLTARWISAAPDMIVVGSAEDGRAAVAMAQALKPDVAVLDVNMPQLDGIAAIPLILAASPATRIIMSSTVTRPNADAALKALSLGASDCIAKPRAGGLTDAVDFQRDLIARIRALMAPRAPAPTATIARLKVQRTDAIVIAASTGGPEALRTLIADLGGRALPPILIVQHMPAVFTAALAEQLDKLSPSRAVEAAHGTTLQQGCIYVAPGDKHMRIAGDKEDAYITLDEEEPVNFCRPAADPLFFSAREVFGDSVLCVVLTGMGHDGRDGAQAIQTAGGRVVAQDSDTSVVWGMPGAVVHAGIAHYVRPIGAMARTLLALCGENVAPHTHQTALAAGHLP